MSDDNMSVQGELQVEILTAKDEAAREGVSVRTIYKRRALARAQENKDARTKKEESSSTLYSVHQELFSPEQNQAITELNGTVNELNAKVNELNGIVKVQTEELTFYRDLMRTMLPGVSKATTDRPGNSMPWWILVVILAVALIVGGAIWFTK